MIGAVVLCQVACSSLALLACLGMNQNLVRTIAQFDVDDLRHLSKTTVFATLLGAILATVIFTGVQAEMGFQLDVTLAEMLPAFLLAVPFSVVSLMTAGYMKARGRPASAVLQESGLTALIAAVIVLMPFQPQSLTVSGKIGAAYLFASVLVAVLGLLRVRAVAAPTVAHVGGISLWSYIRESNPFLVTALANFLNANFFVVIIAIQLGQVEAGILRAAERLAMLVSFALVAINAVYPRYFAQLFYQGDHEALYRKYLESARYSALLSFPFFAVIVCFPKAMLATLGGGVVVGAFALQILALGHFVNAATGSVGPLLNMSGNQHTVRNVTILMLIAGVPVLWVVSAGGIHNAAIVISGLLVAQNVVLLQYARRRLWA
ncbi:MAG TPA: hypothetical protein DCP75_05550 [Haliea salexigens]|uniref:Polysaccharide biosynthesis protein C-terminal domain-containing protein n=1 Tax=Haliea salexigens TaxID=287487 RepID=A0A3C1KKL4_9GAMM|nr:hypothetical protein [Haliea sp.]HAN27175.1 hypothetical protein [Haliea salexigens]